MLFYNNLFIKVNDKPMLLNLISFRRRFLNQVEEKYFKDIIKKNKNEDSLTIGEEQFISQLKKEKQILEPDMKKQIENELKEYFNNKRSETRPDVLFTIQITEKCNMNCSYCYQKRFAEKNRSMRKEQILMIKQFQESLRKEYSLPEGNQVIGITGGEPLLNNETVDLINLIANTWPNAKLSILTNGINLLKYRDKLPLNNISDYYISLDGTEEIYSKKGGSTIYNKIISGLRWLMSTDKNVHISTVIMPDTVNNFPIFLDFLKNEGFFENKNFNLKTSVVSNLADPLQIDTTHNNKEEVINMSRFIQEKVGYLGFKDFSSIARIQKCVFRDFNSRYEIKDNICDSRFCNSYFYSPNGNVYFCSRILDSKGIVGKFEPHISFNKDLIQYLNNRSIYNLDKCKVCEYKFICLGGCPMSALSQDSGYICGAFGDKEIIQNLSYYVNKENFERAFSNK